MGVTYGCHSKDPTCISVSVLIVLCSLSPLCCQIERETRAVIGGKDVSTERASGGGSMGGSTVAVVSIVLALRGDQLKRLGLDRSVNSVSGESFILYLFVPFVAVYSVC